MPRLNFVLLNCGSFRPPPINNCSHINGGIVYVGSLALIIIGMGSSGTIISSLRSCVLPISRTYVFSLVRVDYAALGVGSEFAVKSGRLLMKQNNILFITRPDVAHPFPLIHTVTGKGVCFCYTSPNPNTTQLPPVDILLLLCVWVYNPEYKFMSVCSIVTYARKSLTSLPPKSI